MLLKKQQPGEHMDDTIQARFSRRERQIMQILYRRGKATAAEVLEEMPDPPSYSAVRALLRILEEKDFIKHTQDGARYVYQPRVPREKARHSALRTLLNDLFEGSREKLLAALLDERAAELTPEELDKLSSLIERARGEGR
jgi:predicted transcriptional regulator